MAINTWEVLSLVAQLCDEEQLRVPIKESLKGGLIAGATTTVGGLLLGPLGLAIGGAVGGLTAAFIARDKFKSVAEVIRDDLTPAQRERLSMSVMRILNSFGPAEILAITAFTLRPAVKEKVLQEVFHFFHSQLKMEIID